ncbi:MAG: type II secretion system F family protein [Thermaerobacter sp.]|nr:type II secretion system F family protein [Thermaerobacter sp.]
MQILLLAALGGLSVYAFGLWIIDRRAFQRQERIRKRMGIGPVMRWAGVEDELDIPFVDRIVRPLIAKLWERLGDQLVPQRVRKELARELRLAGSKISPEIFVVIRVLVTVALASVAIVGGTMVPTLTRTERLGFPILMAVIGYVFMGARLKSQGKKRLHELEKNLPELFDFLSVAVEAGLAFDAALRRLVQKTKGIVQEEFGRVLSDIQVGLTREEALRGLADRTKLIELARFAALVTQSDRTGAGIANTLKVQGQRLKELRVFRAREQAATLPVKLLFPMAFFIFPTLFIVILGPGVLSMIKAFSHHP